MFARFDRDGRALELLDEYGRRVRARSGRATAPGSWLALRPREDELVWVVTGAGRARAWRRGVRALDERRLRDAFAVAVDGPPGREAAAEGAMSLVPVYRPPPERRCTPRAPAWRAAFCCALALVGALYRHPLVLAGRAGRRSSAPGWRPGWAREVRPLAPAGAAAGAAGGAGQPARLPGGRHAAGPRRRAARPPHRHHARGARRRGAGRPAGDGVIVVAFGLLSAAVDPDELLRLFRRVSYRSALTASLATRLVPVLARDALRMGDAARCRPQPARPAGRGARGAGGRARPRRSTWRPRSRCAATRSAGRPARAAAAVVAARRAGGGRGARHRGWSRSRDASRVLAAVEAYPALEIAWPAPERGAAARGDRAARAAALRRARGAAGGGPCLSPLAGRAERFAYRYPEAAPAGAARRDARARARARFTVLAGVSGSGKSTLLRALCGLVPHFHGGEVERRARGGRARACASTGRASWPAVCGTVFQEPETQVVMGGVRAELELPLEHRGEPAAAIARAVEEMALALGRGAPARPPHRHALGRRAAAGGDRRRDGAPAARCCCSTSPPRSSTPWPATSSSGCCAA